MKPLLSWIILVSSLAAQTPVRVGTYSQQVSRFFTTADGLPSNDVLSVAWDGSAIYARTTAGAARFSGERWASVTAMPRASSQVRDTTGREWSTTPEGVAVTRGATRTLYTAHDGLPFNQFTSLAAGDHVWFGTRKGAIRFDGRIWEYRQGLRWLPEDDVRAVALDDRGDAWFATPQGVGRIESRPMTFAEKAKFFEDEIDRRHRRTEYGFVLAVSLPRPGDKSEWRQHDSDNDGLWTAMYGAGECFGYAATRDPAARKRAQAAFEALRFLQTVTQGGQPPARPGFVARTVLPASGPDPNTTHYTRERDQQIRASRDSLWKVLWPRWPRSADGKWFWKADTSSDELDGHFFFYGLYYDLVAESAEEKQRVRQTVAAITDHLIRHDFTLVDWDGTPTRWAVFGPQYLNRNPDWWEERGLNSLSILAYLKVAHHVTGDAKYQQAYLRLVNDHSYAFNAMLAKVHTGPGTGNQSDDEMAMMDYYHLIRYETEPALRAMYLKSLSLYWRVERHERNPFFHFVYAALAQDALARGNIGRPQPLDPAGGWLEDSLDTLRRFPLDRVNWRHTNSHRLDIVKIEGGDRGHLRDGRVLPIDERFVDHWNHDPYQLDTGGDGRTLADGASFLLPYYMGLYHKFLE